MPRTRSIAWSQLKVGLLALIAVGLAAFLISSVGAGGMFSWQKYRLKTRFNDVQGLKAGAVVRVAGVEVGAVDAVEFAGPEVEVVLAISKKMQDRITTESKASIGTLSLLGEGIIDVSTARGGTPLKDGDTIPSVPTRGNLSSVAEGATKSLEEATKLLADVRAGKGTVGRLFTDDSLFKDLNLFIDGAEKVTAALNAGEGTIARLIKEPDVYQALARTVDDLSVVSARLSRGEGGLGALLKDESFAKSLSSATRNLDDLSARLTRGDGTVARLVNDPALFNRLNGASERLDSLLADLKSGQGTAGQLLRDERLYENMNGAVREVRDLLAEIRKDPKKYLTVRVSIF